jgi:nucleotide-binding universal stress UspA family protein
VNTILIGVDASERSQDAIAFARRLAEASGAHLVVANAYPYSDVPSRASNHAYREALRDESLETVSQMRAQLEGFPEKRSTVRITANVSPAHALHAIADAENVSLLVVGSTHTGRSGRVFPGSTGERLLHGSPCAVAVVPTAYRQQEAPIQRIGVAYNHTPEARVAAFAAAEIARSVGAELEVIGVVDASAYGTPAMMGGPSEVLLREDIERHVQDSLDALVADLPPDVKITTTRLAGDPAEAVADRTQQLDLLVTGSRGYGPLRSVLVGGFSGRIMRMAHCPVIVVPRGTEAPLADLFGDAAAAVV